MLDILKDKLKYNQIILAAIPFMAVCATAIDALFSALIVFITVVAANVCISALKSLLTEKTATFAQIIIAIGIVGVLSALCRLFAKDIIDNLNLYLPLTAVTAVLLVSGDFALNNTLVKTMTATAVMGGANVSLIIVSGILREILGKGSLFGFDLYTKWFSPIEVFASAAGGLLTAAGLTIAYNLIVKALAKKQEVVI